MAHADSVAALVGQVLCWLAFPSLKTVLFELLMFIHQVSIWDRIPAGILREINYLITARTSKLEYS